MFASSSRAPTAMMLRSPCHATCVVRPSFACASVIFAPTMTAPGTLRRCDSKIIFYLCDFKTIYYYLFSRSCRHRGRQELGLRRYRHLKVRHRGRRAPLQPSALIQYMPRCHRSHSRNPSSSLLIDADLLRVGRSYRWPESRGELGRISPQKKQVPKLRLQTQTITTRLLL
jgi:hypothetical protein